MAPLWSGPGPAPAPGGLLTEEDELRAKRKRGGAPQDPDPLDPNALLGPVGEFTLSISDEVVRAAMAGAARAEEPAPPPRSAPRPEPQRAEPQRAEPQRPESTSEQSFSRPRPGSRSLPAPPRPMDRPVGAQVEPLTTGVVPGVEGGLSTGMLRDGAPGDPDAPGPYTTELMMDGLDERSRAYLKARPQAPSLPPTYTPAPSAGPISQRLPDVEMPPADTGRARPLSAKPRSSAWRPPPAPKPERPPQAPEPNDDLTSARPPSKAGASRSLDELLTLADEPPEREDTVSGATIDLGGGDLGGGDLGGGDEPAGAEREREPQIEIEPVPVRPSYTPPSRGPTPLRPLAQPPPEPEAGTLTGSLELLDEEAPEAIPMPRDMVQSTPIARVEPRPSSRPEGRPPAGPPAEDPLATRPIPRLPDPAPAPPAPRPPPAPAPAPKAEDKPRALDSSQLRREVYKPKEPGEAPADKPSKRPEKGEKADKPSKPVDREYREPILAWLASIIGLILIGGGVVIFFVIVAWLMA
jgi:hypothetical protein